MNGQTHFVLTLVSIIPSLEAAHLLCHSLRPSTGFPWLRYTTLHYSTLEYIIITLIFLFEGFFELVSCCLPKVSTACSTPSLFPVNLKWTCLVNRLIKYHFAPMWCILKRVYFKFSINIILCTPALAFCHTKFTEAVTIIL